MRKAEVSTEYLLKIVLWVIIFGVLLASVYSLLKKAGIL